MKMPTLDDLSKSELLVLLKRYNVSQREINGVRYDTLVAKSEAQEKKYQEMQRKSNAARSLEALNLEIAEWNKCLALEKQVDLFFKAAYES